MLWFGLAALDGTQHGPLEQKGDGRHDESDEPVFNAPHQRSGRRLHRGSVVGHARIINESVARCKKPVVRADDAPIRAQG